MKNKMLNMVVAGYNQIARSYLTERQKLKTKKYIDELTSLLPKGASVLDVGCGAGVPVDDLLLKKGFYVIGIDVAIEQIKLARRLCKGGDYRVRDLMTLKESEYSVSAVICLYTMFHVDRLEHTETIKIMASYLPIGGYLLVSMGDVNFEGEHDLLGAKMWSSQWGVEKNRSIVKKAGFEILLEELNTSGSEKHQIIFAKKI